MGGGLASIGKETCAHGGLHSVDHRQVKLDFSSNVNPLGPPPSALKVIKEQAGAISSQYPDPECTELRSSLGSFLSVDPDQIVVGNGAVEIIYWFAEAFAGKKVVIPTPTFCEYELASQKVGAVANLVELNHFRLDADSVVKAARDADAIFLCNPNNPTGLVDTLQVERIVDGAGKDTMILLDECFIELVQVTGHSLLNRLQENDNLVILRSLTKSFALAGLRVGYAIGKPSAIKKLKKFRVPWNVNGLAQAAGVAALTEKAYLQRANELIEKERNFLQESLGKMKTFQPYPSDANFFLIGLGQRNSTKFRDVLLTEKGILVRDCSTFTGMGSHHIRVAVRTRPENIQLLKALEEFDHD